MVDEHIREGGKALMAIHNRATAGLKRMGIARTKNAVGDYGEWLVCGVLGLDQQPPNRRFDAVDGDGLRYEIKTRMAGMGSRPTVFGGFHADRFDVFVGVFLDEDAEVELAVKVGHDDAVRLSRETADGRFILPGRKAVQDSEADDITSLF